MSKDGCLVEKYNQTLLKMMETLDDEQKKDWKS